MDFDRFREVCAAFVGSVPLAERPVLLTRMVRHLDALQTSALEEWRAATPRSQRTAAEADLALQVGLATGEVTWLAERATERAALPGAMAALSSGRIGAAHLDAAVTGLRGAPASVVAEVDTMLAAGPVRTAKHVRRTVREIVGLRDPGVAARRAQTVVDERSVKYTERKDGGSRTVIDGPAMHGRQLVDSLRSLAMTGWEGRPGHDARNPGEIGVPARMFDALYERVTGLATTLPTGRTRTGPHDDLMTASSLSEPAPARDADAVVDDTPPGIPSRCPARAAEVVLTSTPETVATEVHLAGHGWIPAMPFPGGTTVHLAVPLDVARRLTVDPLVLAGFRPLPADDVGIEVWVVVVDGDTTRVVRQRAHDWLDGWKLTYTPRRALRRYVRRRDQHCRFPGCLVPAAQCHLDHVVARVAGGLTTRSNLVCLCAQHHLRVKHSDLWHLTGDAETTLYWVGPGGRVTPSEPPALLLGRPVDEIALAGP